MFVCSRVAKHKNDNSNTVFCVCISTEPTLIPQQLVRATSVFMESEVCVAAAAKSPNKFYAISSSCHCAAAAAAAAEHHQQTTTTSPTKAQSLYHRGDKSKQTVLCIFDVNTIPLHTHANMQTLTTAHHNNTVARPLFGSRVCAAA